MADTPNIKELRKACGSDELSHVFTFLQSQDITEDEGFLIRMGDDSTQLRAKLDKRNDTIDEAFSFGPDNEVAKAGEDCLVESQVRDHRRLDLMAQLLLLTHEGIEEKKAHIEKIKAIQAQKRVRRCPDPEYARKMIVAIDAVRVRGDSVGGVVTCIVRNLPEDLVHQFLTNLKLNWLRQLYQYLQPRALSLAVDLQDKQVMG
ncbi:chorismate synthase [Artemisia annua]|uniref:chorismate synthase n=1 Tax=Artemisia annua TaxID=35608 RepID=A0A2U1M188_ARTAN|nr:chorismate synthase [Artemisia annua]